MSAMRIIFGKITDLFFIQPCQGCGTEHNGSSALCELCLKKWVEEKSLLCPFCNNNANTCSCGLTISVHSLIFYNSSLHGDFVRRLIFNFKQSVSRTSTDFFARELAASLLRYFKLSKRQICDYTVVYPPRAKKTLHRYGFDQCAILSKSVAHLTGASHANVFERHGNQIQKNLGARKRAENADMAYSIRNGAKVAGKRFILIDDVVTTGATLQACASLLYNAGAEEVFICSIAKTARRKTH